MNQVFSGWIDHVGGVIFGFIKGALIVSVLFITLTAFLPKGASIIQESLLCPYVSTFSSAMARVVSKDMKRKIFSQIRGIEERVATEKTELTRAGFKDLTALVKTLRGKNGCPWDQKQTPRSMITQLIEETYELLDAIGSEDSEAVCEELGDVLFSHLFFGSPLRGKKRL